MILNLQSSDQELSKRLIDFASGLTYALDGGMQRVADKVFLLTPRNVEVCRRSAPACSSAAASSTRRRLAADGAPLAAIAHAEADKLDGREGVVARRARMSSVIGGPSARRRNAVRGQGCSADDGESRIGGHAPGGDHTGRTSTDADEAMGDTASSMLLLDAVGAVQNFLDVFISVYILVILAYIITSWIRLPYSPDAEPDPALPLRRLRPVPPPLPAASCRRSGRSTCHRCSRSSCCSSSSSC